MPPAIIRLVCPEARVKFKQVAVASGSIIPDAVGKQCLSETQYPPKLLGLSLMTKYLQSGALGVINFVTRIGTLAELGLVFI